MTTPLAGETGEALYPRSAYVHPRGACSGQHEQNMGIVGHNPHRSYESHLVRAPTVSTTDHEQSATAIPS